MSVVFSFPTFIPSTEYTINGYNIVKSAANGNTLTTAAIVSTGSQTIGVANSTNFKIGDIVSVDQGANQENVTLTGVGGSSVTGIFAKTHLISVQIVGTNLSQNPYGPWTPFITNTPFNLDIVDLNGTEYDLYRVQPIITVTQNSQNQQLTLPFARPFTSNTPLYDTQISALIQNYRQSFLNDMGIPSTDSTVPTESTGQGAAPFITDANTSRFYLAFISNTEPVKFRPSEANVYLGTSPSSAVHLIPYQDYYPNGDAGYIDFKTNPGSTDYLKIEYSSYAFTDDQIRNMLVNAVSALSLHGIDDGTYQVNNSWNYYYLQSPLPNRDIGKLICNIATKELFGAQILSMSRSAEQWKIGSTQYTSDPSRSIQGTVEYQMGLDKQIRQLCNNYIINTRSYFSRGEFDSFFDNSGLLYPPFSVYNVFNYMSWWM